MTCRHCLTLLLACTVATGTGVAAGPEECLKQRDNVAVAGCANKYSRAVTPTAVPSPRAATQIAHQPIQQAEQWLLFPVPTAASRTPAPAPPPVTPEVVFERDRSELIRRAGIGAIALAAMGLLFGIWRWRASLIKTCTFCGSHVAPDASICKRCFRST